MDFLKPYQGPGRNAIGNDKINDDEETECDLGLQMLTKGVSGVDEEMKASTPAQSVTPTPQTRTAHQSETESAIPSIQTSTTTSFTSALLMPVPSLPNVLLPPALPVKPMVPALPTTMSAQIFPLPSSNNITKTSLQIPASSAAGSVGCLLIEPQFFADNFRKELKLPPLGLFQNTTLDKPSTQLISMVRPVHPAPQTAAINLSTASAFSTSQPPPNKMRKTGEQFDADVGAVMQANRDLDANTLFFLSLARTVRLMPTRCQSLAKMRCMRIVSDMEVELENVSDCNGFTTDSHSGKNCSIETPPPLNDSIGNQNGTMNEASSENFVYMMSPSRVENMVDLSCEEEQATQTD